MNIQIGDKALITTDNWFYAPDGKKYKAVWGTVHGVQSSEQTLGVKTNAKSTNWYVLIGDMVLAGCQIHYAIKADKVNFENIWDYQYSEQKSLVHERPCEIYNSDQT